MVEDYLLRLESEFVRKHTWNRHILEFIPVKPGSLSINPSHLKLLHAFALANPIYHNVYEETISKVPCMVYEGNTERFWLSSISNCTSTVAFAPTWIISAYMLTRFAKKMGVEEVVDVGSGDGRITYCANILGLDAYSIEIDRRLADLQVEISNSLSANLDVRCTDAVGLDYSRLKMTKPAFFIGGLKHMGGDILARSVIEKIRGLWKESIMVFAEYPLDNPRVAGWNNIINIYKMKVIKRIVLPAAWVIGEPNDTSYIFARLGSR